MAKLLYIESSPRKERSHSIAVAHAFLDAYRSANPGDEVETWDLWAEGEQLPEFDGPTPRGAGPCTRRPRPRRGDWSQSRPTG